MCAYVQERHNLGLNTPLGPDALLLVRMRGEEEMSRLFRFDLEMLADHKDAFKDAKDKEIEFRAKLTEGNLSDHV
ncbi:MAG: hypothetical protein SGJ19_07875, partial [Planctomycetia bacterium]|nr:hypothetical protein [Planctomycetia bacterium]